MKKLFVIRHAKSSWQNFGQKDFDRDLNDRGLRDAPNMAKRLFDHGIKLDALVSSPAVRAFTTATYFAEQFGFSKKDIFLIDRLYHAPSETFYDVIQSELNDTLDVVAIFSHNPGITDFVNSLGITMLDNMPTCGIFGVEADAASWKDFAKAKKRFILFDYPKNA